MKNKKESFTMKKVLLTGLTGFIGLHLAKKLLKDGWEVHAIVRPRRTQW